MLVGPANTRMPTLRLNIQEKHLFWTFFETILLEFSIKVNFLCFFLAFAYPTNLPGDENHAHEEQKIYRT